MATSRPRLCWSARNLHALADKGYFSGREILACHEAGITATVPRPETSGNRIKGMYVKADFAYDAMTRRLSLPGGRGADLPLHHRGERPSDAAILDQRVPEAARSKAVAPRARNGGSPDGSMSILSKRRRPDCRAASAPMTSAARRSSTRSARSRPGWAHPFPDTAAEECPNGNGAERAGLQHQAAGLPGGHPQVDDGDPELSDGASVRKSLSTLPMTSSGSQTPHRASTTRVSTQPRPSGRSNVGDRFGTMSGRVIQ